jgi:hypothetical protein
MKQPIARVMLAAAVVGLLAATAGPAHAGTIVSFSYSGRGGGDNGGLISNGTGSFSFPLGFSAVGLGNLTSFNFTLTENTPDTTTFGLSDLTSFSASLGPGPTVASLSLATGFVQGSALGSLKREFTISSLSFGGANSYYDLLGFAVSWTSGTVTINSITTSVPEPSTFALAVLGALLVAGGRSCHRKARAAG